MSPQKARSELKKSNECSSFGRVPASSSSSEWRSGNGVASGASVSCDSCSRPGSGDGVGLPPRNGAPPQPARMAAAATLIASRITAPRRVLITAE